jgi:thiol-disulfide isomerase/thioredoxin
MRYILTLLLCIASLSYAAAGEFTMRISGDLAMSTMVKSDEATPKVPRSKCPHCKGTGKVKAGDTVTVKIVDCEHCFDDKPKGTDTGSQPGVGITGAGDVPAPPAEPPKVEKPAEPPKVEVIEERGRRMLFVHAEWCPPCRSVEQNIFPILRQHRWRIGNANTDQIQSIDQSMLKVATEHVAINDVERYPTFIVLEDGYEIDRYEGYLDQWGIGRLWNRKPVAPAKKMVCGPDGCVPATAPPGDWLNVKFGKAKNTKQRIIKFREYLKLFGDSGTVEIKPTKPGEPVKFQINDKATIIFEMPFKLRYEIKGETISLIFETPPPVSYKLPLVGDKLGNVKEARITTERIDITLEGMPDGYIIIES